MTIHSQELTATVRATSKRALANAIESLARSSCGVANSGIGCRSIALADAVPLLNARELATVLAALRYWQREELSGHDVSTGPESEIANDAGDPLTADEIDTLCERINC